VPFTLEEFRADVLSVTKTEDGPIQCRYCKHWFVLDDVAVDHADPLSRGGSSALDNLDYPCHPCNDRKGSLTSAEYNRLLEFLESPFMRFARRDILSRLEKANALAAGMRRIIGQQKKKEQGNPVEPKEKQQSLLNDKNHGLGEF
jgi:hypothetical protein